MTRSDISRSLAALSSAARVSRKERRMAARSCAESGGPAMASVASRSSGAGGSLLARGISGLHPCTRWTTARPPCPPAMSARFRTRGRQLPNGTMQPMEDIPSIAELTARGARVVTAREPQAFLDDMFYLSGEIPRVTPFETGLPLHFAKTETGWEPDPWIIDERWLGVNVAGKGVIVFTACSHAGVVNVLNDARVRFPGIPLYCVLGGLHLSGPTEKIIPDT